jgi:hypothetical protein
MINSMIIPGQKEVRTIYDPRYVVQSDKDLTNERNNKPMKGKAKDKSDAMPISQELGHSLKERS